MNYDINLIYNNRKKSINSEASNQQYWCKSIRETKKSVNCYETLYAVFKKSKIKKIIMQIEYIISQKLWSLILMKQVNLENNIRIATGVNLLRELENAPQRQYGVNQDIQQQQKLNDVDYRSRRNAAKMAQLLQQQNYQQNLNQKIQYGKHLQQSIERNIHQNQDLNSSNSQSKNTSSLFIIPVIKDLNQERMIQRMKSKTIHSEQSSPKMDKVTPQKNLNNELNGFPGQFKYDCSPKITEQNNSIKGERMNQHSMGLNHQSGHIYNQNPVARSQSREKELIQSTNLNTLETEWSKIKKEHNFDTRSQSPFRFHAPSSLPTSQVQYNLSQLSNSNFGNDSKTSFHSSNGMNSVVRTQTDIQHNFRPEGHSSLERSIDSNKKPFENSNSLINTSSKTSKVGIVGEQKQKQKTLIKKSVPLSKINLELVKTEQLSGRQLTAGRKTPKSSSSTSSSNQKSSYAGGSSTTPSSNSGQQYLSSSSLSNRQHRMSQDGKEESHFQTILDKYQNVHKKQQQQQNLNNSNLSNNSSTSFQTVSQGVSQPFQIIQSQQQDNNLSNCDTSSCTGAEQKRNSVYDSRQSFNFKVSKEDGGQSPMPVQQQIYNFSSKIINPSNYHTSPGFTQIVSSLTQKGQEGGNKNNNNNYIQNNSNTCILQNQQQPPNSGSCVMNNSTSLGTADRSVSGFSVEKNPQQSNSTSKIHNQIKIMSPKQNDLKIISMKSTLVKQNSSENMSQQSFSSIFQDNQSINSQQFSYFQKGEIEGADLTVSKNYGKSVQSQNSQERDVKQLIMNKIHKMNVAKIFLKEEEIGSINGSHLTNENNIQNNYSNNYQNNYQYMSDMSDTESNNKCTNNNIAAYSPISSSYGDRNPLCSSSPYNQSMTTSVSQQMKISQQLVNKYQPLSETKKISSKTVNSNKSSPEQLEDNNRISTLEYKKYDNQNNQQQQQYMQNTIPNQVYYGFNNSGQENQYQIHDQKVQNKFNYSNDNVSLKQSSIGSGTKYQINIQSLLAQNEEQNRQQLKENKQIHNGVGDQNQLNKNYSQNQPNQYHVFSSTQNVNSIQSDQQSNQSIFYQRINPLQVSTNINRLAGQTNITDQTGQKITTIKSTLNTDSFNYHTKNQNNNKNIVIQSQIDQNKIHQQQSQYQIQNIDNLNNGGERSIYRSNSTEGQLQLGQLQNGQVIQQIQNIQKQYNIRGSQNSNYEKDSNSFIQNQNKNSFINYHSQQQLNVNQNILPNQTHQVYQLSQINNNYGINQNINNNINHGNNNNNYHIQQTQEGSFAKLQPSTLKQTGDQYQGGLNSSQKLSESKLSTNKRSFLGTAANDGPKIKKAGSFFAN